MGLDCSHNAFNGSYGAFNNLRSAVAFACGGSHPPHYRHNLDFTLVYDKDGGVIIDEGADPNSFYLTDRYRTEGIMIFLTHSDCDGEISSDDCLTVARDLQSIIEELPDTKASPHLDRNGGYKGTLQKFIDGCRLAYKNDEPLEFY